jgi:8-oxo-dGTP pyrophosphatase MutT (NUDIX family)
VTTSRDPHKRSGRAALETSAGGVVYRVQDGEPMFLLIRDSYQNWGFPKGHLETDEPPEAAALREVREETGLDDVALDGTIDTIDWFFRFRGRLVHKVCHFYLMRSDASPTTPQRAEGITACRWASFQDATQMVSYANAREVLTRAHAMVRGEDPAADPAQAPTPRAGVHTEHSR